MDGTSVPTTISTHRSCGGSTGRPTSGSTTLKQRRGPEFEVETPTLNVTGTLALPTGGCTERMISGVGASPEEKALEHHGGPGYESIRHLLG